MTDKVKLWKNISLLHDEIASIARIARTLIFKFFIVLVFVSDFFSDD